MIAIIALLAGLLLPALGAARDRSKAARCLGQVRQIGVAIQNYVAGAYDYLPMCTRLGPDVQNCPGIPSLPQALEAQMDSTKVFQCPADQVNYPKEGTSYEWNTFLFLHGPPRIDRATWTFLGLGITSPLLGDADAVHPQKSRNYLYVDGHVSSSLDILIEPMPTH